MKDFKQKKIESKKGHDHDHHGHEHDHSEHKDDHKGHDHHGHDHDHNHDHHGHDHDDEHDHDQAEQENLNIRAAMVHVIGDMFQSIGVIIAAIVIHFAPNAKIIDPICTFVFSFIVLLTTIPILIDCIKILMESTPQNVKVDKIQKALEEIEGVKEVHDLHIWVCF